MKPEWILIANATHARVLAHERGSPMVVLKSFEHPEGRSKISELTHDRMGREKSDQGMVGTAYQPHVDAKHKENLRFARELADYLEPHAQQDDFRSLAIFASSPFLGELKTELGSATTRLLTYLQDLDLTSFGLSEVERRVAQEMAR